MMEVILSDSKTRPSCPHGPCLIFERYLPNGEKTGRKFYACSACRDRADCSFFQWVDDHFSPQSKEHWMEMIKKSKPPFMHEECVKRLESVKSLPLEERKYCRTCSVLLLPGEKGHKTHEVISDLSLENLLQPSLLFETLDNKKAEAQYFFTDKTISFVVTLLEKLGFSKLVLIGIPKIHEYLTLRCSEKDTLCTFLMDIDHRYMQFFGPGQFCHYNLFNNHFFGGNKCKKGLKEFLTEQPGEKVAILLDPPFGGLVDAICCTLKKINKWWQKKNSKTNNEQVPLVWFFPYFLEGRIVKNMRDLIMMDYKVEYANHKKFRGKVTVKDSPVRIFTNIQASSFILPTEEGYKFCNKCQRFVSKENKHCQKCNACATKHGKTYRHCDQCQKCVKSSYKHCKDCDKCCFLPFDASESVCQACILKQNHSDSKNVERCFKCGGIGHRKRYCTVTMSHPKKKRKNM